MPSDFPQHRAKVDANGDIILPPLRGTKPPQPIQEEAIELPTISFPQLSAHQIFADLPTFDDEEPEVLEMQEDQDVHDPIARDLIPHIWSEEEFSHSETGALLLKLLNPDAAEAYAEIIEQIEIQEEHALPPASDAPTLPVITLPRIPMPAVPMPEWTEIRSKLVAVTNDFVQEGARQYQTSLTNGKRTSVQVMESSGNAARKFWRFLAQPVWVPGRRSVPKKRSRGMLFVTDVFRFGGTFAGLFGLLFLSLNYQSFWDIVSARLDPLSQTHAQGLIKQELVGDAAAKLGRVPSLSVAGQTNGNLLAYLPQVGPPENRIVIPKLDLNVPIVIPSTEALMAEDWAKLEQDIQEALEDGVVHYPGTAKPGQAGNFFLTGHSSYFPWAEGDYKSVFARLHALDVGDEYWVFYGGDRHRYVIQEKKEVKPSDVTVLDQPLNKRISTIMTCTPVGTTLRRLIIRAQEVNLTTAEPLSVGEHELNDHSPQHKLEMLPI
jgi:LPXTG-site transpeptidase (sortase) family protein